VKNLQILLFKFEIGTCDATVILIELLYPAIFRNKEALEEVLELLGQGGGD